MSYRILSLFISTLTLLLILALGACSRVDQPETEEGAKANLPSKAEKQKERSEQPDEADSKVRIPTQVATQKTEANLTPQDVIPKAIEAGKKETQKPEANLPKGEKLPVGRQPDIQVDKRKYDFGRINERDLVAVTFKITNTGDADLNIRRVKPSCGCTVPQLAHKKLAPNENTKLKVTFNPRGRRGLVHKAVTIYSNDPDEPKLKVELVCQIETYIAILPEERVFFAGLVEGEPWQPKEIRLLALKGETFQIKDISTSSEQLKTELTPIIEDERNGFKVKITLSPGLRPGIFRGKITVKTDHPKAPQLFVPVSAVVRGRVSVVPRGLSFGLVPKGKQRARIATITKIGEPTLKIEKIETTANFLKAEIYQVVEEGKRYRVKVTFLANEAKGQRTGKINIHTNEPSQPVLTVTAYGYVRDAQQQAKTKIIAPRIQPNILKTRKRENGRKRK